MINQSLEHQWINTVLENFEKNESSQGLEILESCGRSCFNEAGAIEDIKKLREKVNDPNNIEKLFDTYKKEMYNNSERLKLKDNVIYLEYPSCGCPMVKSNPDMNGYLCNCTKGYSKAQFETLFDQCVEVELKETVLRGSDKCRLEIRL